MVGIPCHFQAVKQLTKLITEACLALVMQIREMEWLKRRWSREHTTRGQGQGHKKIRGQGQPFQGKSLSRPRTGMFDVKAKNQGHKRKRFP